MSKRTSVRWLAMLLVVAMSLGFAAPAAVYAEQTEAVDLTGYQAFLADLKVLEGYAEEYYAANPGDDDTFDLVLNYVRTGVEKYTSDSWQTLAGAEITGFVEYVAAQDAAQGTTASDLREITQFQTPNGQTVEFEHMFGTMNISYVNKNSADLGGWAGDLCDLVVFTKSRGVTGEIEEMVADIRENYLLLDEDGAKGFGILDIYGDLDGFYLTAQMRNGVKLSQAMEDYFTQELTDADRAAYFMNNRFSGLETNEDVRAAVYDTYKADVGIKVLEADEGITSEDADLRTACCYAFADYLFELAGDRLEGEVDETTEPQESSDPSQPDESTEPSEPEEPEEEDSLLKDNDYYSDFSAEQSVIAPGVVQTIKYALTNDAKQIAYYIATVDVSRDDLTIYANYKDNDPSLGWGMARVEDQVAAAVERHTDPEDTEHYIENYTPVVAVNGDYYNMSTGMPSGALVMEGVEYNGVGSENFFAIMKDGSAMIGTPEDWEACADQIQEAIGGRTVLVQDGEIVVTAEADYYSTRASRTCVGITPDGQVVLMVLDGRQEPFSAGGAMVEIAQIMLEAGCEIAINLDGGGSSTYLSKPEGGDQITLVNSPSDGYARSVSTSLVVVSTAKSSREFDHAVISSDYDYLTIGTELQMTVSGVSNTGNAAPLPEHYVWQVSDEAIATIGEDGLLCALDNGEVEVQVAADGQIVGSKTMNVVVPNGIGYEVASISAIYGVPTELPLYTTYNGNRVAFNCDDVILALTNADAGEVEGLVYTAYESAEIRSVQVYAMLLMPEELYEAYLDVTNYHEGEAIFDFDSADAGDRNLAWNRDVSNASEDEKAYYHVTDPAQGMDISYVFALDMESIQIPEKLKDIVYMLPGADDPDATAWSFLMQLAERVSTLTEVKITAQFDEALELDLAELTVVNDYFYLREYALDEQTNTLTILCGWYDQTAAIDPEIADPICILSGIRAVPKADAEWDENEQLAIVNTGEVTYDIYLRASSLYSFASDTANQEEYGLYPFINPNDESEKGAHFADTYVNFTDAFTLDNTNRQGWYSIDTALYYYVDNVALTGVQYVPSYEDNTVKLFYQFDTDGACLGTVTGLTESNGELYYAIQGEMMTDWRTVATGGVSSYYFFDRKTGAAVDGEQVIDGYDYLFEDHVLVRGDIVTDEGGTHYRWAGRWLRNTWIEVEGNLYFAQYPVDGYFAAGGRVWARDYQGDSEHYHIFDDNGVWQRDYSGLYHEGEDTYLVENGVQLDEPGLVYIDGYYYYFCSTGKAVKNCTYWPSKTNGLLPCAAYKFDEQGRMINPPTTDETEPTEPGETEPVKNGFVSENGGIYYYIDGEVQYGAGLIQVDGDYYYVRSNGQLATGKYWITKTNDLLPSAMYQFDEETGKMLNPPSDEEPEETEPTEPEETEPVKNGIVEEDGVLYYYVDGGRAYGAGLLKLTDEDGDEFYIYVRSNGQLATGVYWPTNTNDLLPCKAYDFGEDGRLYLEPKEPEQTEPEETEPSEPEESTDPSEPETSDPSEPEQTEPSEPEETEPVKNGIVEEDGVLYYYIDGGRAYGAGLLKLTDEDGGEFYIYVRSNGQLATGVYWPTNTNDLLPCQAYDFGDDGRLYL